MADETNPEKELNAPSDETAAPSRGVPGELRKSAEPQPWYRLSGKSWAVALGINLALFTLLALTARMRVHFEFVETDTDVPVVILSRADFEALRERNLTPDEAKTPENEDAVEELLPQEESEELLKEAPEEVGASEEVLEEDEQAAAEPEPVEEAERPEEEAVNEDEADEAETSVAINVDAVLTKPDFSKIDYQRPPPKVAAADEFEGLTGPEIDAIYKARQAAKRTSILAATNAPDVDLPEGEAGESGVIAIQCFQIFTDRDKALECAGRDILSGWQAAEGQFDDIRENMRLGDAGPETPYGPSARAPLKENEYYYGKSKTAQALLGKKAADDIEDAQRFEELKDPRKKSNYETSLSSTYEDLGIEDPIPDTRFQPSWTLREDPDVDLDDVERIMNEAERARRGP